MHTPERRKHYSPEAGRLESALSIEQILTLRDIEHFGWELKVVRKPMFQDPIAIVFDGSRTCYGVIEADGTLNEHPAIEVRH